MAQYLPQHAQHGHHSGHSGQGGPAAPAGSPGGPAGSRPLVAPHFPLKHLNIVDPLLPGNNLGRSVSKASYSRVKKALALGNRTLEEALLRVRLPGWRSSSSSASPGCEFKLIHACCMHPDLGCALSWLAVPVCSRSCSDG